MTSSWDRRKTDKSLYLIWYRTAKSHHYSAGVAGIAVVLLFTKAVLIELASPSVDQ